MDVTTEFLRDDSSVAAAHDGTYRFVWVLENAIVRGVSTIPELAQTSAILFYYRPAANEIEVIAVGGDGMA